MVTRIQTVYRTTNDAKAHLHVDCLKHVVFVLEVRTNTRLLFPLLPGVQREAAERKSSHDHSEERSETQSRPLDVSRQTWTVSRTNISCPDSTTSSS